MQDDPNVVDSGSRARQFEWRLRYPGISDGKLGTPDDILHGQRPARAGRTKRFWSHLKTQDVLHSFFLPNMRVKQDAVPGMKIPVWFRPTETGTLRSGLCASCAAGDITR